MSGFSPAWLALREPADHAARDAGLTARALAWRGGRGAVDVVDLGAGTGSNLRYLAPRLGPGGEQRWRLIDADAALLDRAPQSLPGGTVRRVQHDLRDLEGLEIPDGALVTASALIDLVSAAWLDALAERCRSSGAAVLVVLSYDGRLGWHPPDPGDAEIRDLVNRHQRTDKGFGPALGPDAAAYFAERIEAVGYRVSTARSDWELGRETAALQAAMVDGLAAAAAQMDPTRAHEAAAWRDRRLASAASRLTVGHLDLFATR